MTGFELFAVIFGLVSGSVTIMGFVTAWRFHIQTTATSEKHFEAIMAQGHAIQSEIAALIRRNEFKERLP